MTSTTRKRMLSWRRKKARATDPATSHAAVATVTEASLNQKQDAVLKALRVCNGRACDSELLEAYGALRELDPDAYPQQSPSGLRTRRHELVQLGKVADLGIRVTLPTGRQSIVWSLIG